MPASRRPSFIHLDWRKASTKHEIMEKIADLLENRFPPSDEPNPKVELVNILPPGVNGPSLEPINENGDLDPNGNRDLWLLPKKFTTKKLGLPQHDSYIYKLYKVARHILERMDEDEPDVFRSWGYLMACKDLSAKAAKEFLRVLALNVGEHPYALGVSPQPKGLFLLPSAWSLEVQQVTNIFKWSSDPNSTS